MSAQPRSQPGGCAESRQKQRLRRPGTRVLALQTREVAERLVMRRLSFELPEFRRILWVSDLAREVWEPRISSIVKAWLEIEWRSVVEGIRPCCAISMSPQYLVSVGQESVQAGLHMLPLGYQGVQNYSYSNEEVGDTPTGQFLLRVAVGTAANVLEFKNASETSMDPKAFCELLGYPSCCRKSFIRTLEQGQEDTTWPTATATAGASRTEDQCIEVHGDPVTNTMLRCLGIRAIPHQPCCFNCGDTLKTASDYIEIGRQCEYDIEMDWLLEILGWPIHWSALHGIAEIRTPVFKISTKTDATATKYTVKRVADGYPEEGAKGLAYPYSTSQNHKHTQSRGYQMGLENPIDRVEPLAEGDHGASHSRSWYYKDNGFNTRSGMDVAHKPIEELVAKLVPKEGMVDIVDLGCGNGVLLKKIRSSCPQVRPWGIDHDAGKIEHAHLLVPEFKQNFVVGNIKDFTTLFGEQRYAFAILALSRLEEMSPKELAAFRGCIHERCDNVIVYDYWNRNLEKVACQVQVQLVTSTSNGRASLAKLTASPEPSPGEETKRRADDSVQRGKAPTSLSMGHADSSSTHGDYTDHGDSDHSDTPHSDSDYSSGTGHGDSHGDAHTRRHQKDG